MPRAESSQSKKSKPKAGMPGEDDRLAEPRSSETAPKAEIDPRPLKEALGELVEAANGQGQLRLAQLDQFLLQEHGFDQRMNGLLEALGEIRVETGPPSEVLMPAIDRERVRIGRDDATLRPYLRDLGRLKRMEREDEVRMSKRMEFARLRFQRFVVSSQLQNDQLRHLLPNDFCESFIEDLNDESESSSSKQGRLQKIQEEKLSFLRHLCTLLNSIRAEFVERNLQLVVAVSMNYRTYGVPVMDLVQEGNAALIRAVEKFDWRKNVRFQTYATFWIRQAVERAIAFNKGIVRVPNYLQQKMRRLRREGVIPRGGQGDVTIKEMSEAFELKPEVASHLLETEKSHFSLDAAIDKDGESFAALLAEDPQSLDGTDPLEFNLLKERLEEVLKALTDQERKILELRYGLKGDDPMTLEKVGKQMRVSRERIRQLQVRALKKLQKPGLLEKLEGFV